MLDDGKKLWKRGVFAARSVLENGKWNLGLAKTKYKRNIFKLIFKIILLILKSILYEKMKVKGKTKNISR